MPNYSYSAKSASGEQTSGELFATNVSDAVQKLGLMGLEVESIRSMDPVEGTNPPQEVSPKRPNYCERIDEALRDRKQLALAIETTALESLRPSGMQRASSIIDALRSNVPAETFCEQGELAGALPVILAHASEQDAKHEQRYTSLLSFMRSEISNRKVRSYEFAYPLTLLCIALGIVGFLLTVVFPTFKKMYVEFELRLPPSTKLIFAIGDFVNYNPLRTLLIGITIALAIIFVFKQSSRLLPYVYAHRILGRIFAGSRTNLDGMAKFTETLASLLSIGTPLPDAVRIAGIASQLIHLRRSSLKLSYEMQSSVENWQRSANIKVFPATVIYALRLGPDTAASIALLRTLSRMYQDRTQARSLATSSLFGPIVIVGIGILVGFCMISFFMPLFSMLTSLSGASL